MSCLSFLYLSYCHTAYNSLQTLRKFLSVACFDTGKLPYSEQLFIDVVFIDILMDGGFFRVSKTQS